MVEMIKRKLIYTLIVSSCASGAFAAPEPGMGRPVNFNPANNPANVMNTLNETLPSAPPPNHGTINVEKAPQTIQQSEGTGETFVLRNITFAHANHPIPAKVKAISQSMIGKKVSLADLQNLANKMEEAYRAQGYLLVQVVLPPQEIDLEKGEVQFQIVEGQIERVIFKGDAPQAAETQLHRYARIVEEEDPITYQSVDRFLVLVNSLPGIDAKATFVPDPEVVGGAELIVDIKQTPIAGFMNMNNRGTSYIGPGQIAAGASVYDILAADSISAVTATSMSNPNQLQYGSLSYDVITGRYATEINPSATLTETRPQGALTPFNMHGQSTQYSLNVNQPLIVSTPQNLTLQSSLTRTNSYNNVFNTQTLYNDTITDLTLGLNYQGILFKTYNNLTLSTTAGLPILGAPTSLAQPSVLNGKTEFIKLNLTTNQIHYFTQRVSAAFNTEIQLTPETMLSSEQIGYGGSNFGQAYTPYIISGDNGFMGSFSLRYDLPQVWAFSMLQPLAFYDVGVVGFNNAAPGVADGSSAESAGVGMNIQFTDHFLCSVTFAKPLRITQTTNVGMGWNSFINFTGLF